MKKTLIAVLPAAVLTFGAVGCDASGGYDGGGTPVINQTDDDFDLDTGKRKTHRPKTPSLKPTYKAPKPPSYKAPSGGGFKRR